MESGIMNGGIYLEWWQVAVLVTMVVVYSVAGLMGCFVLVGSFVFMQVMTRYWLGDFLCGFLIWMGLRPCTLRTARNTSAGFYYHYGDDCTIQMFIMLLVHPLAVWLTQGFELPYSSMIALVISGTEHAMKHFSSLTSI